MEPNLGGPFRELVSLGSISAISWHGGDMMYEMRRRKPEPTLLTVSRDL